MCKIVLNCQHTGIKLMYISIGGVQMFYTIFYDVLSRHEVKKHTCDVLSNDVITYRRMYV